MKKVFLLAVAFVYCCLCGTAQSLVNAFALGSSGNVESGYDILIDRSGNRIITGTFSGIVDFDPGVGTTQLTASGSDIFLAKYSSTGNLVWAFKVGGSSSDFGSAIACDNDNNYYLTGGFQNSNVDFNPGSGTANLSSAGSDDIFVAKYDSSGNYVWAFRIGGTGQDRGYGICLDGSNNAIISGVFRQTSVDFDPGIGAANLSSAGGSDAFIAKYDAGGNYTWAYRIGSSAADESTGVTCHTNGTVYFCGRFSGSSVDFDPGTGTSTLSSSGGYDLFIASFDAGGNYQWASAAGGSSDDYAAEIIQDNSGNLIVTGGFQGVNIDFDPGAGATNLSSAGNYDVFVSKYTNSGSLQWAFGAGESSWDHGEAIAIDGANNIYVVGFYAGSNVDFDPGAGAAFFSSDSSSRDIFIAKYDSSGNYNWALGIGNSQTDQAGGIASGGSYISVTGFFQGTNVDFDPGAGTNNLSSAGSDDIFFAQYGTGLAPVSWLYADAQVVDERVRVRWATASELNNHYFTVERSADLQQWENLNQVPGNGTTSLVHTYADWDETPLAGTSYYRIRQTDYNGSFDHSKTMVVNRGANGFAFYPNPSQGQITVQVESEGELNIYNNHGDLLCNYALQQNRQQLNLQNLPNGLYVLHYVNSSTSLQQKLVLAR